tara:strand:- start:1003 stop:3204 length:2202 start_codon:yes stop_codon:yes gene_type:complete
MSTLNLQMHLGRTVATTALAVALCAAMPAYAQDNDEGVDSSIIVVTAQRREENARDVPITLTTITSEALGQGDVQQLSDIAKLTPALRFDNQGGFAQPTIRGVGTAVSASGSGSNVGIYIDGFYAPNPLSADFQLLSVESVQVLKGPQGTLFGRNSTGGAILVTTSEPSSEMRAVAEVSYGSFNAQKYQAYVTGGSDTVAFDLAGLYRKGNGFVRNIVTGSKKDAAYDAWSIRAGVKVNLSDSASLLFRYTHADTEDPTSLVTNAYVDANGTALSTGAIVPGAVVATRPNQVSNTSPTLFDSKVDSYQLTGEFDLGFGTLTSYTQFRKESSTSFLDLDSSSAPIFDVDFFITDKIFTQELLLTSNGDGPLVWTLGAFYFSDKNRFERLNGYSGGVFAGLISRSQTDTKSAAAFADLTYAVSPSFFVTGGLRYSNDKVKNGGFFVGPLGQGLGLFPTQGFNPIPTISDNRLTPRVVLRYKPTEDSSVYASYTRGHKAAILNPNGFTTTPVNSEKITSYEVGYKYASRGLSFDVSAYYYDYTDLQVASYNGTQSIITNAADSRVYGLEGQLSYEVSDNFQFNLGAAYLDGKYENFLTSPEFLQCLVPACGLAFGTFPATTNDSSGFRMQRSPKFTGNMGMRYSTDLGGGRFALSGNLSYTSKIFFDTSQQFSQKGYELVSLRAEWTDPSEHFTLAIFGDNVTDSKYQNQVLAGQTGIQSTWGFPATIGGSIRIKY